MNVQGRSFRIRRIRADDGSELRALRRRSLTDAPDAFGQTLAEIDAHPAATWQRIARQSSDGDSHIWLFAEADGVLVGVVQGRRRRPATVLLFSMWVDKAYRELGVGRRLIDALDAWGRGWSAETSILWVLRANGPARDFYDRVGYTVMDTGADAETGARFDALAMSRPIAPVDTR